MTANTLKSRTVSRISYYALSALNYLSFLLLGDVFLVDVLQYAGFHDGAIGIVTSASGFVTFVQILLLFVGHKIRKHKAVILFGFTGMGAMFALAYVFALCPFDTQLKQILKSPSRLRLPIFTDYPSWHSARPRVSRPRCTPI